MDKQILFEKPRILDGAMGTMLQAHGLPAGALPDVWNIEKPEAIMAVHREYAAAGAEMLLTDSFGCNGIRLRDDRYPIETLVAAAVKNAREAAPQAIVVLDIGPLGAFLEPLGDIGFEEAVELFAQPIQAGLAADCIMVETMIDLNEAAAAVAAAKKYGGGLPVFCTFSLNEKGRLLTGADIPAICACMEEAGADAVGCNCGVGPTQFLPLLPEFLAHTKLPLIMKPNAGLPTIQDGTAVYDMPPSLFADALKRLSDEGVWALGGCCGTTPAHIRAAAAILRG